MFVGTPANLFIGNGGDLWMNGLGRCPETSNQTIFSFSRNFQKFTGLWSIYVVMLSFKLTIFKPIDKWTTSFVYLHFDDFLKRFLVINQCVIR